MEVVSTCPINKELAPFLVPGAEHKDVLYVLLPPPVILASRRVNPRDPLPI